MKISRELARSLILSVISVADYDLYKSLLPAFSENPQESERLMNNMIDRFEAEIYYILKDQTNAYSKAN